MYALVNDVARYPEFLPYCSGAVVEPVSADELRATVKIQRGLFRSEFTTLNKLTPSQEIQMQFVAGPFKRLHGTWRFLPIGEHGARISFHVDFEFDSGVIAVAFGRVFSALCEKIVDAFVRRARAVYG
jgi:ribosome-associated toxin RatA of RatAB toxin-antitoxin module